MKIFSRANISIVLILGTTLLLFLSIYLAFQKYLTYEELEKQLNKRELFDKSNTLLKALEKERLRSTLYLTKPNQTTLNKLNKQRKRVNIALQQNKELKLNNEIQELLKIRKNVNNLSLNYHQIIFELFHKKIITSILLKMEILQLFPKKNNELQLLRLRENINMEDSFLAYILNRKNSMQDNDILFWDQILYLRELPVFNSIEDETLLSNIQDIYGNNHFSKITEKNRVKLFIASKKGNYPLTFQEWINKTSQQQKKISRIQKLLSGVATQEIKNRLFLHQGEMYRYIIISLLMFILLALLVGILRILKKINKEQAVLTNTVKEIEVDLDENKKQEIKEILTHNSSVEIYKFLAKEIKEPSRAKDLFLANMSHEIRTPLNGIIGFTKELQETKLSENQTEIVGIIEESSENLLHIVNDILDFSKIKAGKIELEHVLFDPIEKFETSIDTYVAKAREKEIELKVCIDPNIPTQVLGDPTKIVQVLTNLISNAIKFTPRKGMIEINISQTTSPKELTEQTQLEFSVKDSGIGVTSQEKSKIFDAFSQADASTSRKYGGTGLGLSISSQFIKHMGGELNVESQVGEGANFYFTLNLNLPQKLVARTKQDLKAYTVGYIPPNNNSSIDKNLKTYVEYQRATFLTYTQRELLNLMEKDLPDLLFIDYKCFEQEGELEYFFDLPIKIVLIAADNREKELVKIKEKLDKILHKPVNFTRTLKALEVLITNKKVSLPLKKATTKFENTHALIAEDNQINQKLIQSVLNRLGLKVTLVSNGQEALDLRKKNNYDIIFMDIQMPIMGGIEATKEILSFEKKAQQKHIPIVALTANALEGDKEKYLGAGMDAYLAKPMNVDELKKVLANFIE